MYVVQVDNANVFLQKARQVGKVRVARWTTAVPREEAGRITMQPAIVLQYSLNVEAPGDTAATWTHREVVEADGSGRADLSNTLLAKLRKEEENVSVEAVSRSGSL